MVVLSKLYSMAKNRKQRLIVDDILSIVTDSSNRTCDLCSLSNSIFYDLKKLSFWGSMQFALITADMQTRGYSYNIYFCDQSVHMSQAETALPAKTTLGRNNKKESLVFVDFFNIVINCLISGAKTYIINGQKILSPNRQVAKSIHRSLCHDDRHSVVTVEQF